MFPAERLFNGHRNGHYRIFLYIEDLIALPTPKGMSTPVI
jgi:hypothetical protein